MFLIGKEWTYNFETITTERVHVNTTSPTGLDVEFDISLPHVPCNLLNIDAEDPSGQTQSLHLDRKHHIWKHRIKLDPVTGRTQFIGDRRKLEQGSTLRTEKHLDEALDQISEEHNIDDLDVGGGGGDDDDDVEECGSCYGAGEEGECCATCDDVKRVYKRKGWHVSNPKDIEQCRRELEAAEKTVVDENEGCNVHGLVALNSGGGSFHLAPGRDHSAGAHDMLAIFEMLLRCVAAADK